MSVENNGKYSNVVTVISMLVSTIIFIKLILSKGIKQVHYLTSTLYVVPIVVSIISFVVHWKTKQVIKSCLTRCGFLYCFLFLLITSIPFVP